MEIKVTCITLLIILFILTSCEKQDQGNQEVTLNSIFQIDFVSKPSTGYTWKWTNKQSITIVDSIDFGFTPFYPERCGSAGIETWKFKGKKKGTESLEFKYNRSWDQNSTIDQKAVTIIVN